MFKICSIGCGNMAVSGHGPSYAKYKKDYPDTLLAACCDLDEERAKAFCEKFGFEKYYTDYIRKGARAMTIITNDAWWGNTPGYRQHLSYASLRAIETRRAIARCANTGISAIISPEGKILQPTPWWEQAVIKSSIPLRDDITFFVSHGDITGRVCTFVFMLLLLALAVRFITRK